MSVKSGQCTREMQQDLRDLRDPLKTGRHLRLVVNAATLIACIVLTVSGCGRVSDLRANSQLSEAPVAKRTAEATRKHDLPPCPSGDVEGSRARGDHKVILSWNASVFSTSNEEVGYCLYRRSQKPVEANTTKTKDKTKKKAPCKQCEQVNVTPIMDTACVDEIVQNDTTYYYAAVAINKRGQFSSLSKQVPARVPGSKEPPKSNSSSSYRSCREWDSPKQAPGAGSQGNH